MLELQMHCTRNSPRDWFGSFYLSVIWKDINWSKVHHDLCIRKPLKYQSHWVTWFFSPRSFLGPEYLNLGQFPKKTGRSQIHTATVLCFLLTVETLRTNSWTCKSSSSVSVFFTGHVVIPDTADNHPLTGLLLTQISKQKRRQKRAKVGLMDKNYRGEGCGWGVLGIV